MIRDATFSDIPAMISLLSLTHVRSKYADRCRVSMKAAEQVLASGVAGQKQQGPGASFVQVAEKDGNVVGFMFGQLSRVYGILDKLSAADVFLINEGRNLKDTMTLIDNYIGWASSNPKVIEVGLSWSDALPHGKDVANIYRRKGARLVGEQFELRLDLKREEAA